MMSVPDEQLVQLAYVVEDMHAALAHWTHAVGAGPFFRMTVEVPDGLYRGTRGPIVYEAAFGNHGWMNIELIAQSSPTPSVYREKLDSTGPGFIIS
ncbi:VOC family protein [Sphingobium aromaticivastans]|uniref:VOC family protein n=1 Tax=Sphingobium aromaticivastans TaxID=1778665 RepID=UPI00301600E7